MEKSEWNFNHFSSNEFDCHCKDCQGKDTGLNMDKSFMEFLSMARASANVPFRIKKGCGYRCKSHNKKIGGASSSEHCYGLAVDIPYYNKKECFRIGYGLINAGFKRIQIYEYKNKKGRGWIHADKSNSKSKPKEWLSIKKV
jgi:hypothetical protein